MNTSETKTTVRQPAFTTREDETGVHVQVALPGVRKEDLKLTIKQSVLQLEAVRNNEVPVGWKAHSAPDQPVTYQLFVRLTSRLDGEAVKAALENGVLALDIPVREEAKPRQISVN